jgi:hypothetical protein
MDKVSLKPVSTVLIESVIVGAGLIAIVYFVEMYLSKYIPDIIQNKKIQNLFFSGFLFHILCEYTGVNMWYAKDYYEKYI